jgi:hypothetical protein
MLETPKGANAMADILKKQNGIGDIFFREPKKFVKDGTILEATNLVAGERLALEYESIRHGTLTRTYSISSVVSYALEYNDCPIEAAERAKERGHKLVWINASATSIHNGPRSTAKYVLVEIGMTAYFQGHFYTIVKAPNDNLDLKPLA